MSSNKEKFLNKVNGLPIIEFVEEAIKYAESSNNQEMLNLCGKELNGYLDEDKIPLYRVQHSIIFTTTNTPKELCPVIFKDLNLQKQYETFEIRYPLSKFINAQSVDGMICFPIDENTYKFLLKNTLIENISKNITIDMLKIPTIAELVIKAVNQKIFLRTLTKSNIDYIANEIKQKIVSLVK